MNSEVVVDCPTCGEPVVRRLDGRGGVTNPTEHAVCNVPPGEQAVCRALWAQTKVLSELVCVVKNNSSGVDRDDLYHAIRNNGHYR